MKRKLAKEIARIQRNGVRDGDICPRCGRPQLRAEGNGLVKAVKAYVCQDCFLSYSLAEEEDFSAWAICGSTPAPSSPAGRREILPIYEAGDRIVDRRSDWPGVITHSLPQCGLYEVAPDGSDEVIVLKDKDITSEVTESRGEYLRFISERFRPGMLLEVVQMDSAIGAAHYVGKTGKVSGLREDGGVELAIGPERVVVYPDTDRLRALGDFAQTDSEKDDFEEFVLEF